MKNIFLSIAIIATGLVASAQVGVGTIDPKVSLQVDKSAVSTEADGVLVPRVTVAELNTKAANYGADQNGALVFVTATAGAANETSNVTTTGFHYYNSGTDKWVALGGSPANVAITTSAVVPVYSGNENIIIYTGSGTNFTLPDPSGYTNKTINFINAGTGTANFITYIPNRTSCVILRGYVFYSTGSAWLNAGGF